MAKFTLFSLFITFAISFQFLPHFECLPIDNEFGENEFRQKRQIPGVPAVPSVPGVPAAPAIPGVPKSPAAPAPPGNIPRTNPEPSGPVCDQQYKEMMDAQFSGYDWANWKFCCQQLDALQQPLCQHADPFLVTMIQECCPFRAAGFGFGEASDD